MEWYLNHLKQFQNHLHKLLQHIKGFTSMFISIITFFHLNFKFKDYFLLHILLCRQVYATVFKQTIFVLFIVTTSCICHAFSSQKFFLGLLNLGFHLINHNRYFLLLKFMISSLKFYSLISSILFEINYQYFFLFVILYYFPKTLDYFSQGQLNSFIHIILHSNLHLIMVMSSEIIFFYWFFRDLQIFWNFWDYRLEKSQLIQITQKIHCLYLILLVCWVCHKHNYCSNSLMYIYFVNYSPKVYRFKKFMTCMLGYTIILAKLHPLICLKQHNYLQMMDLFQV